MKRLALAVLAVLGLGSLAAPLLAPYDPAATDLDHVLSGPTGAHLLGTDALGRDVLSRLMYGGRISIAHAAVAVLTVLVAGVGSGLAAGYLGGRADRVFTWVADLMLAIPVIVTLLAVVAIAGDDQVLVMVGLGVLMSPGPARLVRGATLAVRKELYVAAARVSGLPTRHILLRHVLPRVRGPVLVQGSLLAGGALMIDAGLSYLGFGAQPPTPTWGSMIAEAASLIDRQPWLLVPPGAVLGLAILAFGLLGTTPHDSRPLTSPARVTRAARPAPQSSALLTVRDASITLNGVTVVERVSLDIEPGEAVGLVGESGCGKTVTGRAILGLHALGDGSMHFGGLDLAATDPKTLRGSQIAMISQDPMASLDPLFTAGQHVAELVRRHHGGTRKHARARAVDLLREVGLPDPERVARRYPHELSGGMAQRVGIAMALAGRPRLLIADEPTSALDVTVRTEVLDLLHRLQTERDMAILLISHDLDEVAHLCTRTYVMYAGQIVETGATADLLDRPLHPYTTALIDAMPRRARPGQRLAAIPGTVPAPAERTRGCHFTPRCSHARDECRTEPIPMLVPAPGHETRCVLGDDLADRR
ncbi:dipeptide/oligopeptide/nickel ABC transporter permease/ATP-binding protein [Nonomuraea sp. CA-141351]|uniref:dipeptide/oligopeptide/nickel ABC transporter permease/ATP-binding protein n=1 Tax=Nonomuraea sp. CA-141351 TaxID=3239996 RepID=UPI003D8A069F